MKTSWMIKSSRLPRSQLIEFPQVAVEFLHEFFELFAGEKHIGIKCDVSLLSKYFIQEGPQFSACQFFIVIMWFLRKKFLPHSAFRLKYDRDGLSITQLPLTLSIEDYCCFNLLTLVQPPVYQLLYSYASFSLTLSCTILDIFFIHRFWWECHLFCGSFSENVD